MKNYRSILALGIILTLVIACSPIKESPEPADVKPIDSTSNVNNNNTGKGYYLGIWRIKDRRMASVSVPIDSIFEVHLKAGGDATFTYYNGTNISSSQSSVYKLYETPTEYLDFTTIGTRVIVDKTATKMVWSYDLDGVSYEEDFDKQ